MLAAAWAKQGTKLGSLNSDSMQWQLFTVQALIPLIQIHSPIDIAMQRVSVCP